MFYAVLETHLHKQRINVDIMQAVEQPVNFTSHRL